MKRLSKYHGNKAQWVLDAWTETWLSEDLKKWKLDDYLNQVYSPLLVVVRGEFDELDHWLNRNALSNMPQVRHK